LFTLTVASLFAQSTHKLDPATFDQSAAACTDFYQYVNGGWMKANPIPPAFPSWSLGNILNERNRDLLHDILEAAAKNTAAKKGSSEQQIGDYYASCMDESKIETDGIKALAPELDRIAKIKIKSLLKPQSPIFTSPASMHCLSMAPTRTLRTAPRSLRACSREALVYPIAITTRRPTTSRR